MAGVIINDFVANKRVKLFFLPDDYELIDRQWSKTDTVLQNLQHVPFFKDRTRWCDLTPAHFRLMVARNVQSAATLSEEDRVDEDNQIVSSLNFLICALIRCIEHASDCHIEFMKINRVADMDIAVEFEAAMKMETHQKPKPPRFDPFSVIVDNTRD